MLLNNFQRLRVGAIAALRPLVFARLLEQHGQLLFAPDIKLLLRSVASHSLRVWGRPLSNKGFGSVCYLEADVVNAALASLLVIALLPILINVAIFYVDFNLTRCTFCKLSFRFMRVKVVFKSIITLHWRLTILNRAKFGEHGFNGQFWGSLYIDAFCRCFRSLQQEPRFFVIRVGLN